MYTSSSRGSKRKADKMPMLTFTSSLALGEGKPAPPTKSRKPRNRLFRVSSCWTQLGVLGRQWLKPSRPGSRDVRLTPWPLGREGASRKTTTKLGMWRVGEFCGTPAGEERLPVVVRARLARGRGRGQHSTAQAVGCSDSAVTHQETPSLPQPRDCHVLLRNTQTSRVAGLS